MKPEQQQPEQWPQVEQLYHAALEREAGQRSTFLAEACAGDDELRREVETLLAAHERAGSFIEAPPDEVAAQMLGEGRAPSLVGRQLGPYRIVTLLGAGGMGEVYRARDTRLEREVAVKVLPAHLAQDSAALLRFKREAKAVAALSHPNILAIHDFGTDQGVTFAVMELLEGETLRGHLRRRTLPWREAVEVGAAIAEGLAAAHARGIIHRDIKPENIFLTSDGQVKILDFGVARVKAQAAPPPASSATTLAETVTTPGTVIGTVGYMSPEQVRGEGAEAPSDIFSFGCVLYEMVTGRRAFARRTTAETMAAILSDDPPALSATGKPVPLALERVIRHCLEKQPGERFQSARDLASALRTILSGSGTAETRPARPLVRLRAAPWIVATLVVAMAAIISWWQPWQRRPSGPLQQHLISTFPGSHREASFSPDGSMIAFINEMGGVPQVWVKNLARGGPIQITSGEMPAFRPRWSPNNDQIVFGRGRGWQSIWSIPPLGGMPRKIIENARNPNWSWDGTRLVFEKHEKNNEQIWTARADGSDQREVKGVPTPELLACDRMPSFSPDGSLIAFFQCKDGPPGDLWVIPAAGGQPRQLTFDDYFGGTPAWTPDGRYLIFSSRRRGSRTLWKIAVSGGEPEPVLQGAGDDTDPEISRDGRKLIYTNTRSTHVLTLTDSALNQTRELSENRYELVQPSFSPSGDKLAFFARTEEGEYHVFTLKTDGSDLTQVTRGKGEWNVMPLWSPDGSALYFYQRNPTPSFRKISISGGQSSEIGRGWLWGTHNGAQVDPTEQFIAYSKREKNITVATLIREIATGKETVFRPSLRDPRWSKDGRWILGTELTSSDSDFFGDIVICSADTGACRKLATRGGTPRWSGDGSRVYFARFKSRTSRQLWSVSAEGGDERLIGELQPMKSSAHFWDVSPRGEIVYVRFNQGKHELWLADLPRP